jgi:hypothetical protein
VDDILWQNDNGQAAIWLMSGVNIAFEGLAGGNPGPTWHIKDARDFNADGKADILWQNDSGQAAIWHGWSGADRANWGQGQSGRRLARHLE